MSDYLILPSVMLWRPGCKAIQKKKCLISEAAVNVVVLLKRI